MGIILEGKNLYKIYQTASGKVYALNGISLTFEAGKFYAVIGRSGSGKSTLLHILSGLERPTKGSVMLNGKNLYEKTDEETAVFRRRNTGFIFQQYNLIEDCDIRTNICMPLLLDKRRPDSRFSEEVIHMLGISDKLKKYPSELSGGEQQRAAIARSILAKPKIIFADEPTGNLDKKTGEETLALLELCAQRFSQTLIMVTHDLEIAAKADKIYRIEDGRLLDSSEKGS